MSKVTKPEIYNAFMHLCKDLGKKACIHESDIKSVKNWYPKWNSDNFNLPCEIVPYNTIGSWNLCYQPCYGGWQIQEADNDKGGISCPLGYRRYKNSEFLPMLYFARNNLTIYKRGM